MYILNTTRLNAENLIKLTDYLINLETSKTFDCIVAKVFGQQYKVNYVQRRNRDAAYEGENPYSALFTFQSCRRLCRISW